MRLEDIGDCHRILDEVRKLRGTGKRNVGDAGRKRVGVLRGKCIHFRHQRGSGLQWAHDLFLPRLDRESLALISCTGALGASGRWTSDGMNGRYDGMK